MTAGTFKARPTIYKGIRMRSRLEAGLAGWLDEHNLTWRYEPAAFAGSDGQYLPDFRVEDVPVMWAADPRRVYIEAKPTSGVLDPAARRMRVIWESEPGAVLLVMYPPEDELDGAVIRANLVLPACDEDGAETAAVLWCKASPFGQAERLGLAVPYAAPGGPWSGNWWDRERRRTPGRGTKSRAGANCQFVRGDWVRHGTFGTGRVLAVDDEVDRVEIQFRTQVRVFAASWTPLEPARAPRTSGAVE